MASLRIPPDFPLGALFGKGGSRIKDVSRRCGARINVDQDRLLITFSGYGAAAAAAEYAEQFQEHREAVVSAYPHPAEAAVLLDAALAAGSAFVAARHDEVAAAAERRETLYVLRPVQTYSEDSEGEDELGDLVAGLSAGLRLSASATGPFAGPGEASGLMARLVEALHDAHAFSPSFDQIKLRFNLGRQFFYAPKGKWSMPKGGAAGGALRLHDLCSLTIDGDRGDVNSVFSNALPDAAVPRLTAALAARGFRTVKRASTATMHLIRRRGASSAAVSFYIKDSVLHVRKIKSGDEKLFFLARAHGDDKPDARLKVLAQRHFQEGAGGRGDELWEAAHACRLAGSSIRLSASHAAAYEVNKLRRKEKQVFEGAVRVPASAGAAGPSEASLRISLARLTDPATGAAHWEAVGGCLELQGMVEEQGRLDAPAARSLVHAVLAFCDDLRRAAA